MSLYGIRYNMISHHTSSILTGTLIRASLQVKLTAFLAVDASVVVVDVLVDKSVSDNWVLADSTLSYEVLGLTPVADWPTWVGCFNLNELSLQFCYHFLAKQINS